MSTWYQQAIFYHIYPLGLLGSPKENPADTPAVGERTFKELEAWIPHMKSLGCTALYIGPLFESSSHGYDTRDFRLVDRRLGTNEDFRRFVELCHKNGIRVVADGVFNHTGREFFAFRDIQKNRWDSPYKDWYRGINFDWQSPMGDPFGYEAWQGHFSLPCLNLWNPAVREYLFETVRYWIDHFDIDGIRLDCANVLDFGFMKELRQKTSLMKQDFWLMGEVIHGEYGRWVNDEMLHSVTNYELHKALYSGHNDHNYFEIAHNVRRLEAIGGKLYTFVDNHDEDRIASKVTDPSHLFPIYQLLFTLPGIPSVYYGSEWAIPGKRSNTSDVALRPALSLGDMETQQHPLTEQIRKLAKIHQAEPAFHEGSYKELLLTNRQFAFLRSGSGSAVISAVNNDSQPADLSVPVPGQSKEAQLLLVNNSDPELVSAKKIPVENGRISISLPANGGVILKLAEE